MKLYAYWRSSCSYRVRIGLNLKQVDYQVVPVHLLRGGGEQHHDDYLELSPLGQVPALVLDDGTALVQSLPILEYLDEVIPEPPLWPKEPVARAHARAIAEMINAGTQPLQNLHVLQRVHSELGGDKVAWSRYFVARGLAATEAMAARTRGRFLAGDMPGIADAFLVPQLYNARRFELDLSPYPRLVEVEAACLDLDAFTRAHPDRQPDADTAA